MSGKANKARRKQERLRQRRQQGQDRLGASGAGDVCPLYRDPPDGELYSTWIEGGSIRQTFAWYEATMKDQRGGPDVPDLGLRIPYLAVIYGRMLPIGAAWQLDRHLDTGSLPVRWAPGDPVTDGVGRPDGPARGRRHGRRDADSDPRPARSRVPDARRRRYRHPPDAGYPGPDRGRVLMPDPDLAAPEPLYPPPWPPDRAVSRMGRPSGAGLGSFLLMPPILARRSKSADSEGRPVRLLTSSKPLEGTVAA